MPTENQIRKLKVGDIIYSADTSTVIEMKITHLHFKPTESLGTVQNFIMVYVGGRSVRINTYRLKTAFYYLTENAAKKERVSLLEKKVESLKIQLEAHTEKLKILKENL